MVARTIYCVQVYAGAERCPLLQFGYEGDALAEAERQRARLRRVEVYSVTGDPDLDAWEDPKILAKFG